MLILICILSLSISPVCPDICQDKTKYYPVRRIRKETKGASFEALFVWHPPPKWLRQSSPVCRLFGKTESGRRLCPVLGGLQLWRGRHGARHQCRINGKNGLISNRRHRRHVCHNNGPAAPRQMLARPFLKRFEVEINHRRNEQ